MSEQQKRNVERKADGLSVEPLVLRNIRLHGTQRTSMRLEPSMWEVLDDIAKREKMTTNELCSKIKDRLNEQARRNGPDGAKKQVTFSNAVRVFIFRYYKAAATDEGHIAAGHGMGNPFNNTPFAYSSDKENAEDTPPSEASDPRAPVTGTGQATLIEPMSEVF
jgi:predicted DNA-binding ribbon-helix-helix protein